MKAGNSAPREKETMRVGGALERWSLRRVAMLRPARRPLMMVATNYCYSVWLQVSSQPCSRQQAPKKKGTSPSSICKVPSINDPLNFCRCLCQSAEAAKDSSRIQPLTQHSICTSWSSSIFLPTLPSTICLQCSSAAAIQHPPT